MALTDKKVLGTWNVTGDKILARTFDEGTTFVIVQQVEGPTETVDRFIIREENMLTRDDFRPVDGLDIAATKADLLDLTWPAGYENGPQGLGYRIEPTNFALPAGYAIVASPDRSLVYTKSNAVGGVTTVAGNTATPAAEQTNLQKYGKWIIAGVLGAVAIVVAVIGIRKGNKKKKK